MQCADSDSSEQSVAWGGQDDGFDSDPDCLMVGDGGFDSEALGGQDGGFDSDPDCLMVGDDGFDSDPDGLLVGDDSSSDVPGPVGDGFVPRSPLEMSPYHHHFQWAFRC